MSERCTPTRVGTAAEVYELLRQHATPAPEPLPSPLEAAIEAVLSLYPGAAPAARTAAYRAFAEKTVAAIEAAGLDFTWKV